jgi:hypothetical protein
MAMARSYSRAKHQPAALVFTRDGKLCLLVVGPPLGLFAGQYLPIGNEQKRRFGDVLQADDLRPGPPDQNPSDR